MAWICNLHAISCPYVFHQSYLGRNVQRVDCGMEAGILKTKPCGANEKQIDTRIGMNTGIIRSDNVSVLRRWLDRQRDGEAVLLVGLGERCRGDSLSYRI